MATDLPTKFLETVDAPNLEVRQLDITSGELEAGAFDLVSARKVLEHLADPADALRRMAVALRPGGWLHVEDLDPASFTSVLRQTVVAMMILGVPCRLAWPPLGQHLSLDVSSHLLRFP